MPWVVASPRRWKEETCTNFVWEAISVSLKKKLEDKMKVNLQERIYDEGKWANLILC
jgi:hypothetical protein